MTHQAVVVRVLDLVNKMGGNLAVNHLENKAAVAVDLADSVDLAVVAEAAVTIRPRSWATGRFTM